MQKRTSKTAWNAKSNEHRDAEYTNSASHNESLGRLTKVC
jgi:hypothetical protein